MCIQGVDVWCVYGCVYLRPLYTHPPFPDPHTTPPHPSTLNNREEIRLDGTGRDGRQHGRRVGNCFSFSPSCLCYSLLLLLLLLPYYYYGEILPSLYLSTFTPTTPFFHLLRYFYTAFTHTQRRRSPLPVCLSLLSPTHSHSPSTPAPSHPSHTLPQAKRKTLPSNPLSTSGI